jgi:hypothetical protein
MRRTPRTVNLTEACDVERLVPSRFADRPHSDCTFDRISFWRNNMNKFIAAAAALLVSSACFAQAGTAVKAGASATAETAKEAKENVEAVATKEPKKSIHKAKAKYHKAKAHEDATVAKDAAKEAVK